MNVRIVKTLTLNVDDDGKFSVMTYKIGKAHLQCAVNLIKSIGYTYLVEPKNMRKTVITVLGLSNTRQTRGALCFSRAMNITRRTAFGQLRE